MVCQSANGVGRSYGGREAGGSAPGSGEDVTPSWRPASGKNRAHARGTEEGDVQDAKRSN